MSLYDFVNKGIRILIKSMVVALMHYQIVRLKLVGSSYAKSAITRL